MCEGRVHGCFEIKTLEGVTARVQGDPDMSDESKQALVAIINAVANKVKAEEAEA